MRSYCVKTRFQNSTKRSSPPLSGPPSAPNCGPLSKKISELGPHGPVGPISQKLSSPRRWMRLGGTPMRSRQSSSAWSSEVCTVTHRRSGSSPKPSVIRPHAKLDGALLEVVAEGEVAHHLEEGQVALRRADDVDVEGPEALLHRDRARVGRRLLLGEVRLEGHHAGDREEQARVVGDQARRGHDRVAVVGEVIQEN